MRTGDTSCLGDPLLDTSVRPDLGQTAVQRMQTVWQDINPENRLQAVFFLIQQAVWYQNRL